ncbi:MAG: discoidin domain-containing protein [Acidobacteriota bacterium]|nr:discoidin domain-containing protein [Acidobacteriota bacterium]
MKRRSWLLLVLIAIAACNRTPEPPPTATAPQPTQTDGTKPVAGPVADIDGDNLLNLAYGAALVSRTGELNLESSAVQAMDGLSFTAWSSSPGGPRQTLVFALGGPSRIEQLGVTTTRKNQSPAKVGFAASSDGRSWREIVTIEPSDDGTTMKEVPPFEARYLRVETIEPAEYYAALVSVHAIGAELGPSARQSFGGCWSINTFDATLVQRGARVTGILGGPSQPTYVDGGIEGRVVKLMWMRGPMWGHAAGTLTPDGRNLSAITFHEEPIVQHVGQAWIGSRCETGETTSAGLASSRSPADFLQRTGHWTMSGLIFDAEDRLLEEPSRDVIDAAVALINAAPSQRFRIVAREYRHNGPENLRRTKARVDALRAALRTRNVDVSRVEFVGGGSERQEHAMPSAIQRMLWSRIDLERD